MNLKERNIAITDIETSGDVFAKHEILEIGLVVINPQTLEIVDTLNIKVKPEHIENAVPEALERNGYKEENWREAVSLKEAMEKYSLKTKDAIFYAYNVSFDWGFMNEAFRKTGVKNLMDYHHIDLMSMAYLKLKDKINSLSLTSVSESFGIPKEPTPHIALNGAMQAYYLLKSLMKDDQI